MSSVEALPWQRQFFSFLSFVSSPTRSTCDIRYPQLKQDMLPGFSEKKKMDKKTKKVLYSLEMLVGNATSSSLDFYRSKDRVTSTHHLVGKT